jgi:hypothetical protein
MAVAMLYRFMHNQTNIDIYNLFLHSILYFHKKTDYVGCRYFNAHCGANPKTTATTGPGWFPVEINSLTKVHRFAKNLTLQMA